MQLSLVGQLSDAQSMRKHRIEDEYIHELLQDLDPSPVDAKGVINRSFGLAMAHLMAGAIEPKLEEKAKAEINRLEIFSRVFKEAFPEATEELDLLTRLVDTLNELIEPESDADIESEPESDADIDSGSDSFTDDE